MRRLGVGLAVLIAGALLAVVAPGSAQAAPSTTCAGHRVRTLPFSTGSVLVYRNNNLVCAVTVPKHPGTVRLMSVSVQARGHVAVPKSWKHARTSPSVTVYAGHRCVRVTGAVGAGSYSSGWILC